LDARVTDTPRSGAPANLDDIEDFYDTVPRHGARAEEFGPLTLFVREGEGWPYYARPARTTTGPITVADVDRVRARQRELGIPQSFEWIADLTPTLRSAVEASGLPVHEHPLMILDLAEADTDVAALPTGITVRILAPGDPAMTSALTVGHLAFAQAGTQVGDAGLTELLEAVAARSGDGSDERTATRILAGVAAVAAAVDTDDNALCAGQYQRAGTVAEIVGVGTLPAARRQGLAAAVTAALVEQARRDGIETIFLSAGDEDVARMYARIGFRRIGTALIAEVEQ
jgi:ribosomal protein S18 acetylase RimI-like enzyme